MELRSKPILTALGGVELRRPYYLCSNCHQGQFPADPELDVEGSELSPGVRRMLAVVGSEVPFDQGREQMKLLADLIVSSKAVERTAEVMGEDIAARQDEEVGRALQVPLPLAVGQTIPVLYTKPNGLDRICNSDNPQSSSERSIPFIRFERRVFGSTRGFWKSAG